MLTNRIQLLFNASLPVAKEILPSLSAMIHRRQMIPGFQRQKICRNRRPGFFFHWIFAPSVTCANGPAKMEFCTHVHHENSSLVVLQNRPLRKNGFAKLCQ
ncbi:hypothetical protein CEXT_710381 [Caerostris extrusa]|uniref:Uncharacterized protein n=1 Tax=Caerostris extrusa TaxID=172846 RepID=A0AAV4RP71_CAEEX|nr:hypothetical protein CEXT_710381 [Caerostris extrusa]